MSTHTLEVTLRIDTGGFVRDLRMLLWLLDNPLCLYGLAALKIQHDAAQWEVAWRAVEETVSTCARTMQIPARLAHDEEDV